MKAVHEADYSSKPNDTQSVEEKNKKLISYAVEEVWNKGNYSVLGDIVSSDFVVRSLNPTREVYGVEGTRQFFISLRNAFPDIQFIIKDQVAEGDKVATQWIAEGTHLGSYEGIAPTGRHFKVSAIDIDYIRNGKVAECWTNMDELSLLQQLGILNNP